MGKKTALNARAVRHISGASKNHGVDISTSKGSSKHGLLTMGTCKKRVKLAKHFPSEQEPALKRISQ